MTGTVVYNGRHYHYVLREKASALETAENIVKTNGLDSGAVASLAK